MNNRKEKGITSNFKMEDYYVRDDLIYVKVLSSSNSYNVNITKNPSCTCQDFTFRKKKCKHIYYVLMKVLRISEELEDKNKYTDEEIKDMGKTFLSLDHGYNRYDKNDKNYKNDDISYDPPHCLNCISSIYGWIFEIFQY